MYDGTKSYVSTFRDTRSQSVSGQMVSLSNLIPSTNYSVVVTAINTAGFRNSSDPVIGTTLTGKLQFTILPLRLKPLLHSPLHFPPSTLHPSTSHSSSPPTPLLFNQLLPHLSFPIYVQSWFFSAAHLNTHSYNTITPPPPHLHLLTSSPLTSTSLPPHLITSSSLTPHLLASSPPHLLTSLSSATV